MTDIHEMMSVDPPDGKEGGRKLTRGEKSKIAAKGRRDKEHIAMLDLMKEIPVSMDILEKMDKAAVVKLATYYIKMKHFIQKDLSLYGFKALPDVKESAQDIGPNSVTKFQDQPTNLPESQMMLEALNGFLIFVSKKGSVKFVSNTVQDHLGHKQESLFGKSIYDFIHPNDHHELSKQFEDDQKNSSVKLSTMFLPADEPRRVFYVRMKFSLPKPNSKVKNTGYMLVQWSGKMKRHISTKLGCLVNLGLICICRPMQTTPLLEIRMDGSMFMSRHDLGMTFTFCDSRIITLIGYEPNELLGKTAYHFHNPIDAPKVQACHQNLIVKGTSVSKYYRFLGKNDNWVWLQTRATIIYNTSNVAQYIVCMNFVISEEEGEKYLMLEEHQQANHHSASCVITLPDNPRSYTDCRVKINGGVKIVELQDENLEKTACLNGELDTQPKPIHSSTHLASISGGSQELSTNSNNMVLPEAGYQGNLMVPVPSTSQEVSPGPTLPGSQCMTPTVFESVSQCQTMIPEHNMVTQCSPMMSCGSTDNISMSVETANRIDPLVPEYMSHGSPESACSVYAGSPQPQAYTGSSHLSHTGSLCSNGFIDRTMDNFSQTMGASCSSSHSDDAGYESANSPYTTSYLSPQTVSSACSYDSSDRGYTADITNHSVLNQGQGQTCSYGGGFLMDSTMNLNDETLASHHSMDDGNCDYSNPVLDEIFKSMNQPNSDNLSVNMALVFSTIESLTSQSPLSVSTKVKSPGTPGVLNGSKVSSASVSQPERRTDKPLLRSFLTMPQDDIPKQPLGFLQMCKNNGQGKKSMNKNNRSLPYGIDKQKDPSAQKTAKMNQMSVPHATVSNTVLNNCVGGHTESIDSEQLELTAFPDEFHDFALQNLVNDITDAQAQALIADLQNEVGDTLMDTSEYLENLDDSCTNAGTSTGSSHNFLSNGVGSVSSVTSTIPLSQCKTSINSYSSSDRNKCTTSTSTQQLQHSDPCFGNGPMYPVNGRPNKTAHDHVYHQSLNRLNGQTRQKFNNKCPGNRAQFANNRLNGRQIPNMCQSQSQTSDHCKSELERHLRNRLKSRGQNCFGGHSMYNNEDKPFLQQLLTGELTNDMYIMMEKRRFEEKPIRPQ